MKADSSSSPSSRRVFLTSGVASAATAFFFRPTPMLAQGALTPSAAPAPTMKSLDQVESRTPISSLPYAINTPGSYYLTGNLSVTGGIDGITINASGVTLDLNGYTISSTSGANASGNAILVGSSGPIQNIIIKNGNINGATVVSGGGSFSGGGFSTGIYSVQQLNSVRVEGINVSQVGSAGISLNQSGLSGSLVVRNCTVRISGGDGIVADSVMECTATQCGNTGIKAITACNCRGDGALSHGIIATSATNCVGTSTAIGNGINATVATGCVGTTASPSGSGVSATDSATGCSGTATAGGTGLFTKVAQNCFGTSASGTGLFASLNAINCQGVSTSGTGMTVNNNAENCNGSTTTGTYGLNVGINATNCSGSNASGAAASTFAVNVGRTANNCFGIHGNSGIAVKGTILIGCTGFTAGATTFQFTNKYNMP
jgi:hypothetical protein